MGKSMGAPRRALRAGLRPARYAWRQERVGAARLGVPSVRRRAAPRRFLPPLCCPPADSAATGAPLRRRRPSDARKPFRAKRRPKRRHGA